jgi:signal transduction histidine kinase
MNFEQDAIEALSEGVAVFNAQGHLLYLSPRAERLLGQRVGEIVANPVLARAIESAARGYTALPVTMHIRQHEDDERNADEIAVSLHQGTSGCYLALLRNVSEERLFFVAWGNMLEFVRSALASRLRALDVAVAKVDNVLGARPPNGALSAAAEELAFRALNIISVLSEIMEQADFAGADLRRDCQRIAPTELADEALAEIGSLAAKRGLWVVKSGFENPLPPLYGSRGWLRRALVSYMERFIKHSESASGLEIKLKHIDEHVLFIVRGLGRGFAATAKGKEFVPFAEVAMSDNGHGERLPRLGLALARSVVEQHGGKVRLESSSSTATLMMELPVRLPEQDETAGMEQAMRYAGELKALVRGRSVAPQ